MKVKIFIALFLVSLFAGYGFTQSKHYAFLMIEKHAKNKNTKKLESLIDMDSIIELGGSNEMFYGLKDGDGIAVKCKSIFHGMTIHYALSLYCEDAKVLKQ